MNAHSGGPAPTQLDHTIRLLQALTTATLHFTDRAAASRGLHRSDLQALQALLVSRQAGVGAVTPGDLSQALALSPSATTALVDRLERAGHVQRHHDQRDRRRVSLAMTPHAEAEGRAMFGPMAQSLTTALADFDAEQLVTISRFLEVATAVIEAADPG